MALEMFFALEVSIDRRINEFRQVFFVAPKVLFTFFSNHFILNIRRD